MNKENGNPKGKSRLTRSDIDKASEIDRAIEANLLHQEILLGITGDQSDAILDNLYKDKKAQKPN